MSGTRVVRVSVRRTVVGRNTGGGSFGAIEPTYQGIGSGDPLTCVVTAHNVDFSDRSLVRRQVSLGFSHGTGWLSDPGQMSFVKEECFR